MDQRNRARRARRGGASEEGPRSPAPAARTHAPADLHTILGRFSDALSMMAVVQRSLSARESAGIGDEEVALRHAVEELKAVYNELDAAAILIRSGTAT